MSLASALKKKYVTLDRREEDYVPSPSQLLGKYVRGVGNNLHSVTVFYWTSGYFLEDTYLVSMPKKFRHLVYLKKDDILVIDPVEEGQKVKGEIFCIISPKDLRRLVEKDLWPSNLPNETRAYHEDIFEFFLKDVEEKEKAERGMELMGNPNYGDLESSSSSDSSDGDDDLSTNDGNQGPSDDDEPIILYESSPAQTPGS